MWQSELFCFTCCLSGEGYLRVCVGVCERERGHLKGRDVQERVRSGNIHTTINSSTYVAKLIFKDFLCHMASPCLCTKVF